MEPRAFPVSWDQFHRDCRALAWRLSEIGPFSAMVTVTRGGLVPAAIVARELSIRVIETVSIASYHGEAGASETGQGAAVVLKGMASEIAAGQGDGILVIDDLVDTGSDGAGDARAPAKSPCRGGLCQAPRAAARRHLRDRGFAGHVDLLPVGSRSQFPVADRRSFAMTSRRSWNELVRHSCC